MYLITTINAEECGWYILASGTKKDCELAIDEKIKGNDIYADTRRKNARIVSKVEARKYGITDRDYEYYIENLM